MISAICSAPNGAVWHFFVFPPLSLSDPLRRNYPSQAVMAPSVLGAMVCCGVSLLDYSFVHSLLPLEGVILSSLAPHPPFFLSSRYTVTLAPLAAYTVVPVSL